MPTTDNYDQVTFRQIALSAKMQQSWGAEWSKPDTGYRFSNGRQFDSTDRRDSGIYVPASRNVVAESTPPGWSLSGASSDSVNKSIVSQDSVARGMTFWDNGTRMYMLGDTNNSVFQYSLSSAWDLVTASYDSISFSIAGQDTSPVSLYLKPDASKFYVLGNANKTIYQYSLSTQGSLSTAAYESKSLLVSGQDTQPRGFFFKPDGKKLYMIGFTGDAIYQYSLSTAWDISTATYDSVSFSVGSQATTPIELFMKPDGTRFYVLDVSDIIYQYSMTTAWDLSTAAYDSLSLTLTGGAKSAESIYIRPNGMKLYVLGQTVKAVHQYSLT